MSTWKPSASAWVASVAMMSSASKLSTAKYGMASAVSTSLIRSTWPRKSSGVVVRLALYSVKRSERKVLRDTSKATAMCVGCSSRSRLISIAVKP